MLFPRCPRCGKVKIPNLFIEAEEVLCKQCGAVLHEKFMRGYLRRLAAIFLIFILPFFLMTYIRPGISILVGFLAGLFVYTTQVEYCVKEERD